MLAAKCEKIQTKRDILKRLIDAGADVNATIPDGTTALMIAVEHGADGVEVLLRGGADVNIKKNSSGDTSLQTFSGDTALMLAASKGASESVELLIKSGADVNTTNSYGFTALKFAAQSRYQKCVEALLDAGADVNIIDKYGHTPMVYAARDGPSQCLDLLLNAGADVNIAGNEALCWAVGGGNKDGVEVLISAGADVNEPSNPSLLHRAVQRRNNDVLQSLLQAGADVNRVDNDNVSPILLVRDDVRCLEMLVKAGADVNVRNIKKRTPLMTFIIKPYTRVTDELQTKGNESKGERPYEEYVSVLVNAGADVNATDKHGNNVLHMAVKCRRTRAVIKLIEAGADVNKVNARGFTPLLMAAKNDQFRSLEILLGAGADVNAVTGSGKGILRLLVMSDFRSYKPERIDILKSLLKNRELRRSSPGSYPSVTYCDYQSDPESDTEVELYNFNKNQHNFNETQQHKEQVLMLLYAAGEPLQGASIADCRQLLATRDGIHQRELELSLKHKCRELIRQSLIDSNPRFNLFHKVQLIHLPSALCQYLLYDVTL